MQLINGIEQWTGESRPLYLALGNFDGVHRGHRRILQSVVAAARATGGIAAALIFDPHPVMVLRPEPSFTLLTDIADRAALMAALELDYLVVEPFTGELAALSPELFARNILQAKLKVSGVVVGPDYSFGRGGAGRAKTMRRLGEKLGFAVEVCPLVRFNRRVVSSSAIRALLREGAVSEAAALLKYYFFRWGRVIRGCGIGKKMVFPTANLQVSPHLLWPGEGVYLTAVGNITDKLLFGLTNVGARPTFAQEGMCVETHILDFHGELYNREICLYFLEKLRETVAFSSPEKLKEQVVRDIRRGKELIGKYYRAGRESILPPCGEPPLQKIE